MSAHSSILLNSLSIVKPNLRGFMQYCWEAAVVSRILVTGAIMALNRLERPPIGHTMSEKHIVLQSFTLAACGSYAR